MVDIHPIRNDADHRAAVAEVERLWRAPSGTPDGDTLDILITLIDAYEEKRWPIEAADPIEALTYAIEEMGHSQSELADLLGSRSTRFRDPQSKARSHRRDDPQDQYRLAHPAGRTGSPL